MLGSVCHNLLILVILAKALFAASSRRISPHAVRPLAESCAYIVAVLKGALQIWIVCGGHRDHTNSIWCHHHAFRRHKLHSCLLLRHHRILLHHHLRWLHLLHVDWLLVLRSLSDDLAFCDCCSFCLAWFLIRRHIYMYSSIIFSILY